MIRTLLLLAGLLAVAALAPAAAADIELNRCILQGGTGIASADARCGWLMRPENPNEPDGSVLKLRLVVVPALSPNPKPDALTIINGGPASSARRAQPQCLQVLQFLVGEGVVHLGKVNFRPGALDAGRAVGHLGRVSRVAGLAPGAALQPGGVVSPSHAAHPDGRVGDGAQEGKTIECVVHHFHMETPLGRQRAV